MYDIDKSVKKSKLTKMSRRRKYQMFRRFGFDRVSAFTQSYLKK